MKLILKLLLGLISLTCLLLVIGVIGGWLYSVPMSTETKDRIAASKQFIDGGFVNPEPQAETEITMERLAEAMASHPRTNPEDTIPVSPISAEHFKSPAQPGLRLSWIGHASVLVEIDGVRVLTDPVFSERVSPFTFLGPRRFHPVPVALENLQNIDAVVISHNHYDHLDKATIQHLAAQNTRFFIPLGNRDLLLKWGVKPQSVVDMDWWDEQTIGPVRFVATPARHYSNRGTFDFKKTIWLSWSLIGPKNRVFFSGDSGYSKTFAEIGQKLGPFDATLIKIGAYGPGQAWKDVHMFPDDSIKTHQDLRGKHLLPVHWGTFNLAYHPWDEPIIRTVQHAQSANVSLLTPKPGEFVDLANPPAITPWWEGLN